MIEPLSFSPAVLNWAASQIGAQLEDVASKISRSPNRILAGQLTSSEAQRFAKKTRVPYGYLFLDAPPEPRKTPLPDFRTTVESVPLSVDFFDLFDDITYKLDWYTDYLQSIEAEKVSFIGKYAKDFPGYIELANEIKASFGVERIAHLSPKNPSDLFGLLATKCEEQGVLVFKSGVVGNNTHRRLSPDEFRGFAICDSTAPCIFINGADTPSAWAFTLLHELVHLWIGASALSDNETFATNKIERYCNEVASEILVPTEEFDEAWHVCDADEDESKILVLARSFKVSALFIARKALAQGYISQEFFRECYKKARDTAKKQSKGGNFFASLAVRNSKSFTQRVVNQALSGKITLTEAGSLLNTNANNVVKLYGTKNPLPL